MEEMSSPIPLRPTEGPYFSGTKVSTDAGLKLKFLPTKTYFDSTSSSHHLLLQDVFLSSYMKEEGKEGKAGKAENISQSYTVVFIQHTPIPICSNHCTQASVPHTGAH